MLPARKRRQRPHPKGVPVHGWLNSQSSKPHPSSRESRVERKFPTAPFARHVSDRKANIRRLLKKLDSVKLAGWFFFVVPSCELALRRHRVLFGPQRSGQTFTGPNCVLVLRATGPCETRFALGHLLDPNDSEQERAVFVGAHVNRQRLPAKKHPRIAIEVNIAPHPRLGPTLVNTLRSIDEAIVIVLVGCWIVVRPIPVHNVGITYLLSFS